MFRLILADTHASLYYILWKDISIRRIFFFIDATRFSSISFNPNTLRVFLLSFANKKNFGATNHSHRCSNFTWRQLRTSICRRR